MKVFFDENFSERLSDALAILQRDRPSEGIEVHHVVTEFGRGAKDEIWIPQIAQMHGAVITQDYSIRRTKLLADLCKSHKLGVFFFRPPKGTNYDYWDIVNWVLKHWADIKSLAKSEKPPYEYEIKPRSNKPARL